MFDGQRKAMLMLAKAKADPREMVCGLHHKVVDKFRSGRENVSLRHFSWEQEGGHSYGKPQAGAPELRSARR